MMAQKDEGGTLSRSGLAAATRLAPGSLSKDLVGRKWLASVSAVAMAFTRYFYGRKADDFEGRRGQADPGRVELTQHLATHHILDISITSTLW